ncbi:ORC ubiquitin ligase 1 isoform X2 [Sarcophilus harrisii]|uniref:ORC ubiquitin ligase 1 n=1 Tax=Sarcophilus harrisii TaxID=9305 RepID=A0A7N4PRK1_SARHA|nr:ORC ubiquitin ligase 1 isoform X2 [Sarcophilus harrisii]
MAQNVQNVTLSLTLPITCHICLGKVRHPVICTNNHVFCSVCIDVWLKNNSQCPACRVPITPENPCKEIIGGTSESEPMLSHTVRKHLRKTRLELLHREYEDEIESLQKEVEELRGKNLSLESQLKSVLDPLTLGNQNEERRPAAEERSKPPPETVAEWKKRLRAAHDIYEKVKDDVDKLKEANKKLNLENGGLMRENLRLKAEVDNRSPQKFGRFTVAALQSKVEQYERETNRLKKALERSDKYIEELESQISLLKSSSEETETSNSISQRVLSAESQGNSHPEENTTTLTSQVDCVGKQPVPANPTSTHLTQSSCSRLSDNNSATQEGSSERETECCKNKELFPEQLKILLDVTDTRMDACLERQWNNKTGNCDSYKDEELYDLPAPCTPSLSLSCLQLNTPDNKEGSLVKTESIRKHSHHLRKLVFDDFCGTSSSCGKDPLQDNASSENGKKSESFTSPKSVFWDCCPTNFAQNLDFDSSEQNPVASSSGELSMKSNEKAGSCLSKRLNSIRSFEMNRTRTSSEASMDAAYLDKISELDSMMSESDNSKSPYNNFKSTDMETPTKLVQNSEFLDDSDKLEERTKPNLTKCSQLLDQPGNRNEWKPTSFFILSPSDQEMNEHFPLLPSPNSGTSEIKPQNCLFQREFSQSFLFSNSHKLFDDQRFGPSFFKMSSEMHNVHNHLQSPWSASFVPEKRNKSMNQSAKRKIQSSLSSASPSKATKS